MTSSQSDANADAIEHVVVVGYDHWTEAVLTTLEELGIAHAMVVTDDTATGTLESHEARLVRAEALNEAAFREAGAEHADAILVATFDDRLNVLAVLTAIEVIEDATIATFSDERRDATKLKRAGADTVVNLGPVVAELLVDSALSGADPRALLDKLLADESVVDSEVLSDEPIEATAEGATDEATPTPLDDAEDEEVPTTTSELASESIDVAPEETDDNSSEETNPASQDSETKPDEETESDREDSRAPAEEES